MRLEVTHYWRRGLIPRWIWRMWRMIVSRRMGFWSLHPSHRHLIAVRLGPGRRWDDDTWWTMSPSFAFLSHEPWPSFHLQVTEQLDACNSDWSSWTAWGRPSMEHDSETLPEDSRLLADRLLLEAKWKCAKEALCEGCPVALSMKMLISLKRGHWGKCTYEYHAHCCWSSLHHT